MGLLNSAKLIKGAFKGLNLSEALMIHPIEAVSGKSVRMDECWVTLMIESLFSVGSAFKRKE
ncbi:hypothetical protein D3C86_703370 [compost metagenome]